MYLYVTVRVGMYLILIRNVHQKTFEEKKVVQSQYQIGWIDYIFNL